jgi:gamma-glutamyl phosphate reductase
MYSRIITQRIVELQAHGFSATETQKALQDEYDISVGINTVYRHRKSSVGQEIIEELIRQQERDILKSDADDRELAMRYRNELLKILIPSRMEILSKSLNLTQTTVKHVVELVDPDDVETRDQVQTS